MIHPAVCMTLLNISRTPGRVYEFAALSAYHGYLFAVRGHTSRIYNLYKTDSLKLCKTEKRRFNLKISVKPLDNSVKPIYNGYSRKK